MKSITIHKLPDDVSAAIEKIASTTGLSQNKVIKKLLRKALGIDSFQAPQEDFSEFLGVWDEQDLKEFVDKTQDFSSIDKEMWD